METTTLRSRNGGRSTVGGRIKPQQTKAAAQTFMANAKSIVIEQPKSYSVCLEITGTSDLIQNNFSSKSIEAMLKKHMGLNVQRESKKPRELLEQATVRNVDGEVCLSPITFKKAMLSVAGTVKLKKTDLRTSLFVVGNSIPITFEKQLPRMDVVRLAGPGRTPDIRFRPSFQNWKARLIINFSENLAPQSVVDLLNRSGRSGVGEWRPSRDGTFGAYKVSRHISDPKEVAEVELECSPSLPPVQIPDWALDAEITPELADEILNHAGAKSVSENE